MTTKLLATKKSLNGRRYRHAVELIGQAEYDLTRIDPSDQIASNIVILAHLARAALDQIAYEATQPAFHRPEYTWDELGAALGLTAKQAGKLIARYLDQPDLEPRKTRNKHTTKQPATKLVKMVSSH